MRVIVLPFRLDARAIIDTNVLVYAADARAPQHAAAQALRDTAAHGEFIGHLTTQVVLEFVSVVTSPRRVASPRGITEAWAEIRRLTTAFPVLTLEDGDIRTVAELSENLGVKGADVFDLAIAATALRSGVNVVYTFDPRVFARVPRTAAAIGRAPQNLCCQDGAPTLATATQRGACRDDAVPQPQAARRRSPLRTARRSSGPGSLCRATDASGCGGSIPRRTSAAVVGDTAHSSR